jgi:hypothetical protein
MEPQLLPKTEIDQVISTIQHIDLAEISIEEIKEIIRPLFTGYTLDTPNLSAGIDLFRGVMYTDKPDNISFLSYPPKELAKENRSSRKNHPFFYAATSRQVPLFELRLLENDTLVLSRWKTKKEILVNNIGYSEENFKMLNSNRENPKWINAENDIPTQNELNNYIQNFLAKTFSQIISKNNPNLYKITIAIAEKHYSEDESVNVLFDGILYPSIPMSANGDNLAIRQSFVDEGNLEFMEAEWIQIKNVHDMKFDVEVLDWANSITSEGKINWKGRLQLWDVHSDEGFYFADENGRRIGKNKYGETIEPY